MENNETMESIDDIFKNVFNDEKTESNISQHDPVDTKSNYEEEPITVIEDDPIEDTKVSYEPQSPQVEEEQQREVQERKKASKLQREKFQLAEQKRQVEEEAMRLRYENELLRNQQATSSNASLLHYENSIKLQQANLKESLKKAYDMQDMDMVADINLELGRLGAETNAVNNYRVQEAYSNQQYQPNPYQQYPHQYQQPEYQYQEPQQAELNDTTLHWAEKNPWFNPSSSQFDEDKHRAVMAYAGVLDDSLRREGREDLLATPYYFDAIDQYVGQTFNRQQPQQSLSMNRSQVPVAPVRRGGAPMGGNHANQVRLDADEKEMARKLGVPLEAFAKQKILNEKQNQYYRETGDVKALAQRGQIRI